MKRLDLLFVSLCLFFYACTPDYELPTVVTNEIKFITTNSAEISCEVTDDGGAEVSVKGVCLSTDEVPSIENDITVNGGSGIGTYVIFIDNLVASTTYYVRAYAINSEGTSYGETITFTTKKTIDTTTVQTDLVHGITATSAICGGKIISDGGAEVTLKGVCWSEINYPTTDGNSVGCGSGAGDFEIEIDNLAPSTTYYVRAYAVNNEGTAYGDVVVFTTEKQVGLPVVSTNVVSDIAGTTAMCGGNVISDGGAEVTSKGICWNTTHNPILGEGFSSGCGGGIGNFEAEMKNLELTTTYYVRAYAVNSNGIGYGEEVTFTTMGTTGTLNGFEWVDLGLDSGTKWATVNVGATKPEEYGDYYAWGEIITKSEYTVENCTTHGVQMGDISGDPEFDVARALWGDSWRMPAKSEMNELFEDCNWTSTTQNGVYGMKVTGPNGNSIFLPSGGHYGFDGSLTGVGTDGYFWSSQPYSNELNNTAYDILFMGNYCGFGSGNLRRFGQSVRPVTD